MEIKTLQENMKLKFSMALRNVFIMQLGSFQKVKNPSLLCITKETVTLGAGWNHTNIQINENVIEKLND